MIDLEYYPTPAHVIELMGADCAGKTVLEPSAGSGNIVAWLRTHGATDVLVCEKNADLRRVVSGKGCKLIADDFFTVTAAEVSHVQMIVANPPFSNAAQHIGHMWKVAPEGCEIISLCNWETINRPEWGSDRKELQGLIRAYGEAINLGPVFTNAERKTGVDVGLVRLFKPVVSAGMDFDGFYLDVEEETQANGMMRYDEIRAVVNNYVSAVRCFEKVEALSAELGTYTARKFGENNYPFRFGLALTFHVSHKDDGIITKEAFAQGMQMQCWRYIFDRVGIEKYVTSGVLADVNKFIASRQNYPFTMRNVYRMLEVIVGTREQTMNRAIVEAVDKFTANTHENRFGLEGWKTNAGHLLNMKFITGWFAVPAWEGGRMSIRDYQSRYDQIADLVKALCFVTGKRWEDVPSIKTASIERDAAGRMVWASNRRPTDAERENGASNVYDAEGYDSFRPNTWYQWGFFRFKVFKKGTGHFQFLRKEDWVALNRAYAKIKGHVLPENTTAFSQRTQHTKEA